MKNEIAKPCEVDHRDINKRLQLFGYLQTDMGGAGLLTWLPNGEIIRQELEHFAKETEARAGYLRVSTPVLAPQELYETSGHHPYYAESMYPPTRDKETALYIRPMCCPHHHLVAKELLGTTSLPLRIAEYGNVFRYESRGAVSGLMRARGFTQNDAHIYCTRDQLETELLDVLKMHKQYYQHFGIEKFHISFALPDLNDSKKFSGDPEMWKESIPPLKQALLASKMPFVEEEGEAAFYGPKIDFVIKSSAGKEYTISTTQLDFMAAKRFVFLRNKSSNDVDEPLYVIHRAPLGSHERFIGFLLEHYSGNLPTWLSPTQFAIIPIGQDNNQYAQDIFQRAADVRVFNASGMLRGKVCLEKEHMNKKIKNALLQSIPRIAVVGAKEQETGTVALRQKNGRSVVLKAEDFLSLIEKEVNERRQIDATRPDESKNRADINSLVC